MKTVCAAKNLSWRECDASASRVVSEDAEMFVEGTRNRGMFSPSGSRTPAMRCRGNDAIRGAQCPIYFPSTVETLVI